MTTTWIQSPLQSSAKQAFTYAVYGLSICSELALPELLPAQIVAPADVNICLGSLCRALSPTDTEREHVRVSPEEDYLSWSNVGTFHIHHGTDIVVEPAGDVGEQILRLFILGPVLGVLLHQRRKLVLHASAVVAHTGVIAFVGESGWGKSTTAAAMHAYGYDIMSDDVVVLQSDDTGKPNVLPALPRLKLSPETAASLGYDADALTKFHPQDDRREYRIAKGFAQQALPLRQIYVLAEGPILQVKPLGAQDAFVELIRHSYALRFLDAAGATASHFRQCTSLASSTPIYRLERPRTLSALPEIVKLVHEHVSIGASLAPTL